MGRRPGSAAWLVAAGGLALVCALALWADRHFAGIERLPMQWGLDGAVNWTLPRRIALAFLPVLGAATLIPGLVPRTRKGDGAGALRHAAMGSTILLAVEAFYLYMLVRHAAPR